MTFMVMLFNNYRRTMEYNKLIHLWSKNAGCSLDEACLYSQSIIKWVSKSLKENSHLHIAGFGTFDVRKHLEYIKNDKASHKRILYPPKLTLEFTPASLLEDNVRDNGVFKQLAEMLIDKNQVHHFLAEKLPISFFKSILEMMDEGETVEVEGLGTFLLTKVKVDDAVYGKVAFVPDETLSSDINSPFSFFSPVELTDDVHFDDLDENGTADVETKSDDKVFLISREHPSTSPENVASQKENASVEFVEDEQTKDALPKMEPTVSVVDDMASTSQMESDNSVERKKGNYTIHALIAVLAVACVLLAWNLIKSDEAVLDDSKGDVAYSDTLVEESNKEDSVVSLTKNEVKEEQKSSSMDFASLNAKIPYGGYDIIGVASEIKVAPGMTLQKIAQIYLGTEHTIYLEVLNDGKEPQPGQMYKIPKLQLRKK